MAENLQLVSKFLAQPPFSKKVSILDLDALSGPSGLQFLTDVFAALDPAYAGNIADDEPQELAIRIFTFLRLLRYPPSAHPTEQSEWRKDVIEGKRRAVISILVWLSQNLPMVQQRIYLAKYMTKVDVPSDFRTDPEINRILEEQDRAVSEFTATHKEHALLKTDADMVNSLRREIQDLRSQKEQTEQRVAELVTRVRSVPGKTAEKEERMGLARALREEQENCSQLMNKRTELHQLGFSQNDQIVRLRDYTSKVSDDWQDVTPERLLQKLEERVTTQRRAVNEVLPRTIREERKGLVELGELLKQPDFTERNLNELRIKAQMLQTEVFNMSDKLKAASQTPALAEVSGLQAQLDTTIAKKKELTSRNETLHREIRDLERGMGVSDSGRGDMTNLSRKLLSSAEDHERKKRSVEVLEAEKRNASRTYSVLSDEHQRTNSILTEWEKRTGISPLVATSSGSADNRPDNRPTADGRPLAEQTHELEENVASRRKEVTQLLNELQPLRQKHKTQQDIITRENQRQNAQDLQTSVDRACEEVATLNNAVVSQQLERQYSDILLERAENEAAGQKFIQTTKNYIQSEASKLTKLKTEHETSRASHAEVTRQANAWKDLDRLFDMKTEHLNEEMDVANGRTHMQAKDNFDRIVMA